MDTPTVCPHGSKDRTADRIEKAMELFHSSITELKNNKRF